MNVPRLIIDLIEVYAGADENHCELLNIIWKEERRERKKERKKDKCSRGKAETRLRSAAERHQFQFLASSVMTT